MTKPFDPEMLKALGVIGNIKAEIDALRESLQAVPSWRPGRALTLQCQEALNLIDQLGSRFERKLVVTLIGPSGSGKSTLLNALAGVDALSPAGTSRPTTRQVIVVAREPEDGAFVQAELGQEAVKLQSAPRAGALEQILLIDTPDTDSMEQEKHIPIIRKAVALSDILICVFNAENPKTRDHVEFMADFVRRFSGQSLIGVLNKCDRLDRKELGDTILPEFRHYLKDAWNTDVGRVVCISARRHLADPRWDDQAVPKHDFDEFPELKRLVFQTFNRPGYVVDRRMENAMALRNYLLQAVRDELGRDREALAGIREEILRLEQGALGRAAERWQGEETLKPAGMDVLLYQKLAQRWMGPVGWLIALWARILTLGSGVAALLKFGAFRRWRDLAGSLKGEGRIAAEGIGSSREMQSAWRHYRLSLMEEWPNLAEKLIRCRFDLMVRKLDHVLADTDGIDQEMAALWQGALETAMDDAVKRLSHFAIQLLLNLPVIGILIHMVWVSGRNYFTGHYLATPFFVHAIVIALIILLLVFFLFQMLIRMLGSPDRIARQAFAALNTGFVHLTPLSGTPLARQVDALQSLDEWLATLT